MNGNQMDTTCFEIVNETNLDLYFNGYIASLEGVQYFDNLDYLNCNLNLLTSLPSLPNSLTWLECSYNLLTSLPPLPNSLLYLK
jgi:Leucine-rich repeat (LRR) protein